jgi:hypothetical protein
MKKEPKDLTEIVKIILYVLLLVFGAYILFSTNIITGFAIASPEATVAGSFLGVIVIFFFILLVLLKLKAKPYKPLKQE